MITKLKYRSVRQARSYMAALLALALLLPTFASVGLFPQRASAADYNGEFIDAVTISVEGKGTFVDDNPWGDGLGKGVNFQQTVAPNCNSEISGYDGGGKLKGDSDTLTLDIKIRKANSFGQCIDEDSGSIELKSARKATITAYRYDNGTPDNRDDDTIFMPAYRIFTDNVPSTVVSGLNGVFRKVPNDTVIKESSCDVKTDCYIQYDSGKPDDIDGQGSVEWLETVPPVQHYKYCTDAGVAEYIDPCDDRTVDITLANSGNPLGELPSVYSSVDLSGNGGENGAEEAGAGGAADDGQSTCEASGNPLSWILCPIFNGFAELTDWVYRTLIEPFLIAPPVSTDPSSPSFRVWSSFRVIGNIVLVIGMLVIVFGQSLGGGLIDAYTAKKVLPRIVAAAIMVNLSVYFVAIAVDISNIVGAGIQQLVFAPFKASGMANFEISGVQGVLGAAPLAFMGVMTQVFVSGVAASAAASGATFFAALGGVLGGAMPFILLFIILPAALILIAIFVTLALRRALILLLVIISPIAFALYCLPNTEKYFKKWWELLVKALLVYPIVALLFAIADIMAITMLAASNSQNSNFVENGVAIIIAFVLQLLPLAAIPFAFKMAGGLLGNIYGTLSGMGKKGTEILKGSPQDPNSLRNRTRRDMGKQITDVRAGIQGTANRRRTKLGRGLTSIVGGGAGIYARQAQNNEESAKRMETTGNFGNDAYIKGTTIPISALRTWQDPSHRNHRRYRVNNGVQQWQAADGTWLDRSEIEQGHKYYSTQSDKQRAFGYVLGKAEPLAEANHERVFEDFLQDSDERGIDLGNATGSWQGIAIPFKGVRADLRRRSIRTATQDDVAAGTAERVGQFISGGVNHHALNTEVANMPGHEWVRETEGTFGALEESIINGVTPSLARDDPISYQERRDKAIEAYRNLEKYVLGSAPGAAAAAAAAAAGGTPPPGGGAGYSSSSSAAYKNAEAARASYTALQAELTRRGLI